MSLKNTFFLVYFIYCWALGVALKQTLHLTAI